MTKTLNRYNRKRRSKTQRKRRGGLSHYPGQIHNFDRASNNLEALDSMIMDSQIPVLVRHHRKSCPHCEDFEGTWKNIETGANGHPDYSVASLDDWATDHMNKKHYSRHGYSVSGVPTVVMIDRDRVPKEHKGPNTLEALEEFLKKHGMQLKIVPIEEQVQASEETPFSMDSVDQQPLNQSLNQPVEQPLNQPVEQPAQSASFFDTLKGKVGAIDSIIENGVSNATAALTEPITFGNLFSTSSTDKNVNATVNAFPEAPLNDAAAAAALPLNPAAAVTESAAYPDAAVTESAAYPAAAVTARSSDNNQITGAPQVPSITGGRRHRKSKKYSKSKSKRRTKRRLKKMKK